MPFLEVRPIYRFSMFIRDYDALTVSSLKTLLKEMMLPVNGRKAALIERLQEQEFYPMQSRVSQCITCGFISKGDGCHSEQTDHECQIRPPPEIEENAVSPNSTEEE